MTAIIPPGEVAWGLQLPIQSQSWIYCQPWERSAGPTELALVAQAADRAGALYAAVCDHVAIPTELTDKMSAVWYDTVATIGWLAAQTDRVMLLSHVSVLPYRHAAITAKAFGTLDLLSGGRVVLGVGAGHVEREFQLLGVDFASRGRTLDRAIADVRGIFVDGMIDGMVVEPRGVRGGGPPIWVGGSSKPAIRRAAILGDGWLPQGPPEMGMRAGVEFLLATRREHHGEDVGMDVGIHAGVVHVGEPTWDVGPDTLTGATGEIAARLRRARSIGVNQLQLRFAARTCDELCDQIERFGTEIWPEVSA